jgi:hypothetical protein
MSESNGNVNNNDSGDEEDNEDGIKLKKKRRWD